MQNGDTIEVFRGCGQHILHRNMFFSSSESFASSYGEVRRYRITLDGVVNTLDRATIEPLLPLVDPYDDAEISTWDEYEARNHDTWEMVEAVLPALGGNILIITEGGVLNYLVRDPTLVELLEPVPSPGAR